MERCQKEIENVCERCETCIKLRRNPKKPVVGLPMGRILNEAVRVHVGELEGKKFLVMTWQHIIAKRAGSEKRFPGRY